MFLNHLFHFNHSLFGNFYLSLNLKFLILKCAILENALNIFNLIHELTIICISTNASSFASSLLLKIIILWSHCIITTSCFVSSRARIKSSIISIYTLICVLRMTHIIPLTLWSLQSYLLIIYNARCSTKSCQWTAGNHSRVDCDRTQSLNSIHFILTCGSGIGYLCLIMISSWSCL